MIPELLNLDNAAKQLGVTHWTLRTWIREGRIPYVKIGRRVLLKASDLAAFIEAGYHANGRGPR